MMKGQKTVMPVKYSKDSKKLNKDVDYEEKEQQPY